MNKYIVQNETELAQLIEKNREKWLKFPLWLLQGPLGAGKTTFVRYLLNVLDNEFSNVRSPSFSLVHTYKTKNLTVIHADFYRVESASLEDFGLHEHIGQKNTLCVIEWPEKLEKLPEIAYLHITIEHLHDTTRSITIQECPQTF